MKRRLPESLVCYQNSSREKTINTVQTAIDNLIADREIVSKKKLIELTGLSNSTFSKDHIKQVLSDNKVCQYKKYDYIQTDSTEKRESLHIEKYLKENEKLNNKIAFLESMIQDKENRIQRVDKDHEELVKMYELLLGKYHYIVKLLKDADIKSDFNLDYL